MQLQIYDFYLLQPNIFATFCFFALIHTLELGKILELKVETRYRLNVDEVSVADKQACTYGERTACNTSVP